MRGTDREFRRGAGKQNTKFLIFPEIEPRAWLCRDMDMYVCAGTVKQERDLGGGFDEDVGDGGEEREGFFEREGGGF